MKNRLTHNLGLKIMAVLFAIGLWMISAYINNPVQKKTYSVPVQLQNTSSITGQDRTYKVLDNSDTVSVTVWAQKSVLSDISKETIVAKADCSKVTEDGTVPIEVAVSDKSLDNKVESIQQDKEVVKLEIEERKSKQLRIEVVKDGTLPEGYVTGRIVTETNMMSVSGPETIVNTVSKAVVEISLDDVTADMNIIAQIRLLNAEGKEVNSAELRKSIDSVMITVPILKTKEVPVVFSSIGTPREGYAQSGGVSASVDRVLIAGKESALEKVEQIEIPEEELDITDATETVSATVDIRKYLPADISLGDPEFNGMVTLTAGVEQIRRKTISVSEDAIQKNNVPAGWIAEILPGQGLKLSISGLQRNLDEVNETTITPHVDVAALLDEEGNVPIGDQQITVRFLLPGTVRQEGTVTAVIRLTKQAAEHSEGG